MLPVIHSTTTFCVYSNGWARWEPKTLLQTHKLDLWGKHERNGQKAEKLEKKEGRGSN